jgi:hypothetical protein
MNWVDQTKEYTDKGYNNGTSLWDTQWNADQSAAGKVFGFFYSTWGINFTLAGNAGDELQGQYAVHFYPNGTGAASEDRAGADTHRR